MAPDNPQRDLEVNFGGNQRWDTRRYRPPSEPDVLALLERHARDSIRVVGSRHSWSEIAAGADVTLDLSLINTVEPLLIEGAHFVRVGAGCRLKDLLRQLHERTDRTLPTLGAITQQTIAGAISTGTHGSGRQSLSHFVTRIRAAVLDAAGRAVIREFSGGTELRAARCGLGCMGVILSVDLPTVPKHKIAETIRIRPTVADILAVYAERPLTQFLWTPFDWTWFVFERVPVGEPAGSALGALKTQFFRLFHLVMLDVVFHLFVLLLRHAGRGVVKLFFTVVPRLIPRNTERVDDSHRVLSLWHDLLRHEEMELFVRQSDLARATDFLRHATEAFAAADAALAPDFIEQLRQIGCLEELQRLRGSYVHHYVYFFRRVMPEDALISMASSTEEPVISISVFTYHKPSRRAGYYAFCAFLARAFLRLFRARLHWGKHFPLAYADIAPLYPQLAEFQAQCRAVDPHGVLRNRYTARVLGLPRGAGGGNEAG